MPFKSATPGAPPAAPSVKVEDISDVFDEVGSGLGTL
jgi:hypothetical protein